MVLRQNKVSKDNVLQYLLWFNSCFKFNNLPIFYKQWCDKGVKVIDHFENRILMSKLDLIYKIFVL